MPFKELVLDYRRRKQIDVIQKIWFSYGENGQYTKKEVRRAEATGVQNFEMRRISHTTPILFVPVHTLLALICAHPCLFSYRSR